MQRKGDKVGRNTQGMYRLMNVHKFQVQSIMGKCHLVDVGVDGKIKLKMCEIN